MHFSENISPNYFREKRTSLAKSRAAFYVPSIMIKSFRHIIRRNYASSENLDLTSTWWENPCWFSRAFVQLEVKFTPFKFRFFFAYAMYKRRGWRRIEGEVQWFLKYAHLLRVSSDRVPRDSIAKGHATCISYLYPKGPPREAPESAVAIFIVRRAVWPAKVLSLSLLWRARLSMTRWFAGVGDLDKRSLPSATITRVLG